MFCDHHRYHHVHCSFAIQLTFYSFHHSERILNFFFFFTHTRYDQIILAVPFIVTYPISYIKNSFNLGRIFLHKWTVNYRFMSEQIFIHKGFHSILLILHITILFIIFHQRWMNLIKKKIFQNKHTDGIAILSIPTQVIALAP